MTHGPVVIVRSASARVKHVFRRGNAHGKRWERTGTRENNALFCARGTHATATCSRTTARTGCAQCSHFIRRDDAQPFTFSTPCLRSSKASLRHRVTPPMAHGQRSRCASRVVPAHATCTHPSAFLLRTRWRCELSCLRRWNTQNHSAHAHAIRTFQDKEGTLRYAGSTHDEGHQVAHHRAHSCATSTHSRTHRVYAEREIYTQTVRT